MAPTALFINDALERGDAGRTIIWSDDTTNFAGSVFARGGDAWGHGGFLETSGKKQLNATGYANLTAPMGNKGTYLLDPENITIYGNVTPTFVSTDGSVNLASSLKLWLDASDANSITLSYSTNGLSSARVSGVSGGYTLSVDQNVTGALQVGARIRIGSGGDVNAGAALGADTYTIIAITPTSITVAEPLGQSYATQNLYRGLVKQWADKSGSSNHASQSSDAQMPLYVTNKVNGKATVAFDGGVDLLSLGGNYIFSTNDGLTIAALARSNTKTGTSFLTDFGHFAPKSYGMQYNSSFIGTHSPTDHGGANAVFAHSKSTADYAVLMGQMVFGGLTSTYLDGSLAHTVNTSSLTRITGSEINENATTAHDAGPFTIGSQSKSYNYSDRGLNGDMPEVIVWNDTLSTDKSAEMLVAQYQAAKWGTYLRSSDPATEASLAMAHNAGNPTDAATNGYSAFSKNYLERLSQTANINLQASNDITFDLDGATMTIADNKDFTLTAGRDILSLSTGKVQTGGTGNITLNAGQDIRISHDLDFEAAGTGALTFNANRDIVLTGGGTLTTRNAELRLNSDRDQASNAGGRIYLNGARLYSNGGDIVMGGGTDARTTRTLATGVYSGIRTGGNTYIMAGGGDIIMNGAGSSEATCHNNCYGVELTGVQVTTTGDGTISIDGASTHSGANSYNHGVQFGYSGQIQSENGDITLSGTVANNTGTQSGLSMASSSITTNGIGDIILRSPNSSISGWGPVTYLDSGDNIILESMRLNGSVLDLTADNTIYIRPYDNSMSMVVGSGVGDYAVGNGYLNRINAANYVFGSSAIGDLRINTTKVFDGQTHFLTGGDLYLDANLVSSATTGSGLVLSALGDFVNSAGDDALSVGVGSRWLVYSHAMSDITRDGLLPGASEFGKTYALNAPATIGAGNRFIYADTTRAVLNYTMHDGTVMAGNPYTGYGSTYDSGLLAGDTLATIGLTFDPAYSTPYSTSSAAGTYALQGATGSSVSALGYAFVFANGTLTVDPRPGSPLAPAPVQPPAPAPQPALPATPQPLAELMPDTVEKTSQAGVTSNGIATRKSKSESEQSEYEDVMDTSVKKVSASSAIRHIIRVSPEVERKFDIAPNWLD